MIRFLPLFFSLKPLGLHLSMIVDSSNESCSLDLNKKFQMNRCCFLNRAYHDSFYTIYIVDSPLSLFKSGIPLLQAALSSQRSKQQEEPNYYCNLSPHYIIINNY